LKNPTAILLAALLATSACTPAANNAGTTAAAGTGIGVDTEGLNKSVKPCDDFDE
jgi:putative endopeptidase